MRFGRLAADFEGSPPSPDTETGFFTYSRFLVGNEVWLPADGLLASKQGCLVTEDFKKPGNFCKTRFLAWVGDWGF
jgi:hypothetical protein